MAKLFTYQDNLGSMLSSSHEPFTKQLNETVYDNYEDYMKLDMSDYDIYSENSRENPTQKYTVISKNPFNLHKSLTPLQNIGSINDLGTDNKDESSSDDDSDNTPQVPDVIASKLLEQSSMSTINNVYIGSLTILGLYVLFRYMKY